MWQKPVIIILLFYFFALLQNSFFSHFSLFGLTPNLVFILFFILVFIEKPKEHSNVGYYIAFLAVTAGFFLDVYSYTYFGPSIITLLVIAFLLKKVQLSLKSKDDFSPFIYFLPLFVFFSFIYNLSISSFFYFFEPNHVAIFSVWQISISIIYDLVIASAIFGLYKKFNEKLPY